MTEPSATEPSTSGGGPAIGLVLALWLRHWRLALMLAGPLLAGVITLAFSLPSMHRATATLLLEHAGAPEGRSAGDLETRLHTITEDVLSRARLGALMDRFDLYPDLRSTGNSRAAVDRLRSDIQLKFRGPEQGMGRGPTIAFSVSVRGRDPEMVAQVANALATFYRDENLRLRERARLSRLRQELARMQQTYRDQYPDVIRLKVDIATLERQLADGTFDGVLWESSTSPSRLDGAAQREPGQELARGEEVRILDRALPAGKGAVPNRTFILLLGVLFTVGATVAAVLLAEHLGTLLHSVDELRTFSTNPVLSQILNIGGAAGGPARRWSAVALTAAGIALGVLASYYFAHGNEQLVWILARGGA